MKKLLLAILVSAFTTSVAAEWVKIGETTEAILFHDPHSIRKEGALRRVWQIQDLKEEILGAGIRSMRTQMEYDCNGERLRVLYAEAFAGQMAQGTPLDRPYRDRGWIPIPPDTLALASFKVVCYE